MQNPLVYNFDKSHLQGETRSSDRFVYSQYFLPLQVDPAQQGDTIRNLAQAQVGYLFLDRTRIRPQGFAIGEHVYGMSLAPGEEVVVEQKAFSKRETTLEEQEEQERQFDLELSSTLSTELQEGLERQRSLTTSTGLTAGGSLGVNIKDVVEVNAELKYTRNVTEADTETRRRSVKDSTTASRKVASKYRALHKTVFRVATEERFEATNKRVIRNPNKFTPIDLHYFKLLQVLEMRQERYGARLCWAPQVKDPAFDLFERIRLGKQEIMQKAEAIELPPKPAEPVPPPTKPPVWPTSGEILADKWGAFCDMRYDYPIAITVPAGYVWDGNAQIVKDSVSLRVASMDRRYHYYVVGEPWAEGDKVHLKVHLGVDGRFGLGGCGQIHISAKARCISAPSPQDAAYAEAYKAWRLAMDEWSTKVQELRSKSLSAAQEQADAWEQDMLARVNPVAELINRVIKQNFPPSVRDEGWEVEVWRQLFDWEGAAYFLHPSWWSDLPMRDHTRAPTDFFNASWARVYLPIKLGFEQLALRWIFGQTTSTPLSPEYEATIARLQKELTDYRRTNFGDERETLIQSEGSIFEERSLSLGWWSELLPTDGTHVEVVQAMTSAVDTLTQSEIADAQKLRTQRITSEERDNALKQKAITDAKRPMDAEVRINAGEPWPDSSDSPGPR